MPGPDRLNSIHRVVSVLYPTNPSDIASSLFELSRHLWDRFQKQAMITDLDEAIRLATYSLELRLPRPCHYVKQLAVSVRAWVQALAQGQKPDQPVMPDAVAEVLHALAGYLRVRSRNQHDIVDLDAAITLYRCVLQSRPIGRPCRASSLHDLALCLADRFRQQSAAADLNEAIALEQEALQLLISGDPGYDVSRQCLREYIQMKISLPFPVTTSDSSGPSHVDVNQLIRSVAFEFLKNAPTRLFYTQTGILCNRDAQISHFVNSQQYTRLLSSCITCDPNRQTALIHAAVSEYFQYAMLSHRWGAGEPLLRDVEGRDIYGMSTMRGFVKLQAFCLRAFEQQYLWAWSDTCCIDKDSSVELQEAIGSMFAWYRRSSLTIVYLSDVPDTCSFDTSEWFRRGWTLQELLAPQRILFFTQSWSLYKELTSSNHKTDGLVLKELERTTGIEARFLTNFSPGMDDARSRLQWASSRRTTRPEDIAYCLLGIFDVYLPILYGESAEKALGRLLTEIISRSGDISVLSWVGETSQFHSYFPKHIASYQPLPLPIAQSCSEKPSLTMDRPRTSSHKILRSLPRTVLTSFQFLGRPFKWSRIIHQVSAVGPLTPNSNAPSDVSLTEVPLPQLTSRYLKLPCIPHRVTVVRLKSADLHAPSYTYEIQACGLKRLEIALPSELERATVSQGTLQLVRPWHSQLLGSSVGPRDTSEERLRCTLGGPFNALLLTQLPHNEYKRIASSILIIARPIDSAIVSKSKVEMFTIV